MCSECSQSFSQLQIALRSAKAAKANGEIIENDGNFYQRMGITANDIREVD